MKQIYKDNWLKHASTLRAYKGELDMGHYFGDETLNDLYEEGTNIPNRFREIFHECGTSCCSQGLAAVTEGTAIEADEDSTEHINRVFGVGSYLETPIWQLAFSPDWSNDIEQAARRCEYLAKHGAAPSDWGSTSEKAFTLTIDDNGDVAYPSQENPNAGREVCQFYDDGTEGVIMEESELDQHIDTGFLLTIDRQGAE